MGIGVNATLDLTDNDLILQSTAANKAGFFNAINGYIGTGRNRGAWNGPGINSSAAAANAARNTGLAAIINDNGSGVPLMGTFDGQSVDANTILIKYTYDGDSDLDGDIDADDYARLDAGFAQRNNVGFVASYRNGDLNYSGSINSDDFFEIDQAFSTQSGPLAVNEPLAASEPQAAASDTAVIQKRAVKLPATSATKKQKHRKRPTVSSNMFKQEWKSVARY
jgi:hypothetical protein